LTITSVNSELIMSVRRKRKLDDANDDYSAGIESELTKTSLGSTKRHTIDSDEDDDDEVSYNKKKYDVMAEDDIEGELSICIYFLILKVL
jgi:hypothetical protein